MFYFSFILVVRTVCKHLHICFTHVIYLTSSSYINIRIIINAINKCLSGLILNLDIMHCNITRRYFAAPKTQMHTRYSRAIALISKSVH